MKRNGKALPALLAVLAVLAILVVGTVLSNMWGFGPDKLSVGDQPTYADLSGGVTACSGVSSVSVSYNDLDKYVPGTDPGVDNLYITTQNKGAQAEGAITLTPLTEYTGLAAENSTTVFSEPVTFKTACSAVDYPVNVVKAGAPTITFTNDNGVTINADATDEAVSTDTSYGFDAVIKAPGDQASSRHGALLVFDFDKTYVSDIDLSGPGISAANAPNYLDHASIENATGDGFRAFLYSGELADNAKLEVSGTYTTTSTANAEGNANFVLHWIPLNYDINQDTLAVIGPAAEDEDNNAITIGNTTAQFYTN